MGSQFVILVGRGNHCKTDLIGPYPRSKRGNTYALIVLDQLNKFVLIKPTRSTVYSPQTLAIVCNGQGHHAVKCKYMRTHCAMPNGFSVRFAFQCNNQNFGE